MVAASATAAMGIIGWHGNGSGWHKCLYRLWSHNGPVYVAQGRRHLELDALHKVVRSGNPGMVNLDLATTHYKKVPGARMTWHMPYCPRCREYGRSLTQHCIRIHTSHPETQSGASPIDLIVHAYQAPRAAC